MVIEPVAQSGIKGTITVGITTIVNILHVTSTGQPPLAILPKGRKIGCRQPLAEPAFMGSMFPKRGESREVYTHIQPLMQSPTIIIHAITVAIGGQRRLKRLTKRRQRVLLGHRHEAMKSQ